MIRIYQCDEPCCTIQPHSKRFWKADYNGVCITAATSQMAALQSAAAIVMSLQQEVTA